MSSNDMIMIVKIKEGLFEVYHNLCVDNPFSRKTSQFIGKSDTLAEAFGLARNYNEELMDQCWVPAEYGIQYADFTGGHFKPHKSKGGEPDGALRKGCIPVGSNIKPESAPKPFKKRR